MEIQIASRACPFFIYRKALRFSLGRSADCQGPLGEEFCQRMYLAMHAQKGLLSDSFNLPWKLTSQPQLHWLCSIYLQIIFVFHSFVIYFFPKHSITLDLKSQRLAGPSGYLTRKFCDKAGTEGRLPLLTSMFLPGLHLQHCCSADSKAGCFSIEGSSGSVMPRQRK